MSNSIAPVALSTPEDTTGEASGNDLEDQTAAHSALLAHADENDDIEEVNNEIEDCEDREDSGFGDVDDEGIPFGTQGEVNDGLRRARHKKTLRGYLLAVETLRLWCERHKDMDLVKGVATIRDDGSFDFDYKKLAKSLESPENVYFRYTIGYQTKMQNQRKSGLGAIKRLRSGLSKVFLDHKIIMSDLAIQLCKEWMQSRKNDDMAAKLREHDPVKYSNAQKSLPWPAYKKIAELLATKLNSPFLWCLFVLQWNMIARVSNACTPKFSLMDWNNDRMTIKHAKTKMDQEGKNAFPMALMANRYEWYICPITALAVYMSSRSFTRGSDQLFSGSSETISKRYSDSMRKTNPIARQQ